MFNKIGETLSFSKENIISTEAALANPEIVEKFVKIAKQLKRVAPKASDFVYATAIIIHAAEASLVDQTNGEPILNKSGKQVEGKFEKITLPNGKESVKWVSADNIKPYKNNNGDIFPEEDLVKAYRLWVGKPLCKDHVSDSVDGIRGIIIDTYYDNKFKRVHALFALDKKNYPDLAHKVQSGTCHDVSMGTAVARSVCYDCGNVATIEREFCEHVRSRNCYGEINLDLNPIELSLVVTGADPLAKIKHVIASMNEYTETKSARIEELKQNGIINVEEMKTLAQEIEAMQLKLANMVELSKTALNTGRPDVDPGEVAALGRTLEMLERNPEENKEIIEGIRNMLNGMVSSPKPVEAPPPVEVQPVPASSVSDFPDYQPEKLDQNDKPSWFPEPNDTFASDNDSKFLKKEMTLLQNKIEAMSKDLNNLKQVSNMEENNMKNSDKLKERANRRRAYFLGGGGINEPTPGKVKYPKEEADKIRNTQDKQMVGEPLETGSDGLMEDDLQVKQKLLRAEDLEARRNARRAYFLGGGGVNEPTPGKVKYPKEEADKIRNTQDKQMVGEPLETGSDGLFPGDEETKKKLLRATLKTRFVRAVNDNGSINKNASRWEVYAGDKLLLTASGAEAVDGEVVSWDLFNSKVYGEEIINQIREHGFDYVAYTLKGDKVFEKLADAPTGAPPAAAMEPPPAMPMGDVGAPAGMPPAEGPGDKAPAQKSPKEKALDALNETENKLAEVRDLISGLNKDELADVGAEVGSDTPMDQVLASLDDLMDASANDLTIVSDKLDNADTSTLTLANEALEDNKTILTEASLVIEAAKKVKKKKEEKEMSKKDKMKMEKEEAEKAKKKDKKKDKTAEELLSDALRVRAENRAAMLALAEDMYAMDEEEQEEHEHEEVQQYDKMEELVEELMKSLENLEHMEGHENAAEGPMCAEDHEHGDNCDMAQDNVMNPPVGNEEVVEHTSNPEVVEQMADDVVEDEQSTKQARKKMREALLARATDALTKGAKEDGILGEYQLKLSPQETVTEPTFFQAHPKGGTTTELTYSKTPGAKVETIEEVHDAMLDVARSGPRNVRDAAEQLNKLIVSGKVAAKDLDKLVALGKADSETVKYWKQFLGEAGDKESSSWADGLVKDYTKKKAELDQTAIQLKIRRAYDLGLDAQSKGMCGATRADLDKFVDNVLAFDDKAFESYKKAIASTRVPAASQKVDILSQVGLNGNSSPMNVVASVQDTDLFSQLQGLNWSSNKK